MSEWTRCVFVAGAVGALVAGAGVARATEPWASGVVNYVAGSGVDPAYTVPSRALGEPTRFTGVGVFPGAVTPFNPAWMPEEIVSIGPGGSLTLEFGRAVMDDPLNPFGIDFIVFGNAGYIDTAFPAGVVGGMFGVGGGLVEVSANGSQWAAVPGASADSAFPTLGYLDLIDPYATSAGSVLSDFTRPVDPSLSPMGMAFAQVVAGYAGSGGGTGIDIGASGLGAIQFVRISNPSAAAVNVDIDGMAIVTPVPGPGGFAVAACGGLLLARRRRGGCR